MRTEIVKYINEKVPLLSDSKVHQTTNQPNITQVLFTQDSISYRPSTSNTRLPSAGATHLTKILQTHTPINPEHVFVADSPTSLGNMLGYHLAERGEGILVNRPVYGRFELDYGIEAGVEIVYADTATEEAFVPSAVDKYERALVDAEQQGIKIRAVLLVNPHNPVGVYICFWSLDALSDSP